MNYLIQKALKKYYNLNNISIEKRENCFLCTLSDKKIIKTIKKYKEFIGCQLCIIRLNEIMNKERCKNAKR